MASAGRRAYAGSGPRIGDAGKFEGDFSVQADPPYIEHRLKVWERLYTKHQEELAKKPRKPIKIELPDGTMKDGQAFETTPMEVAKGISKGLAESVVVAKLIYKEPVESLRQCVAADNDEEGDEQEDEPAKSVLWDLTRPLEGSCRMELLKFDDPQGQDVFWHSSAHILGEAMERKFGCHLTIGPALELGFYYDGFFGDRKLGQEDYSAIEKLASQLCKEQQPFERCVLSKEDALELFSDNPFKVQLITNKVPDGALTSCYRCGSLVDLCRGPHLPNTGKAKAFMITKNSSAYWLGDQSRDSLQRLYGIAFPTEKALKEFKQFQEEAANRDHRNLGKQQELFMQHQTASPGSTFWFPAGARLYNKLIDFLRSEYRLRGFTEVVTPNIYSASLFMRSGHYQNYAHGMYGLDIEKEQWFMKPMNCPGHFLMFDSRIRSYKELPMRFADFGTIHRNEASGALSGLTRVRRFQQDDGHVFVRPDQIKQEVANCLDFLNYVYGVFGFTATYALSTRPKESLGSKELWDDAESQLRAALNESGRPWSLNPGDGAFYGPKIDIRLTDAMKRKHQCGTIQLDYQAPIRFNLQYRKEGTDEATGQEDEKDFEGAVEKNSKGEVIWKEGKLRSGFERPVIIHRAVLGSIERMSAILIEHYAGKWPFWLNPRQVMVVPVGVKFNAYASWVERQVTLHGFYAEVDTSSKTLPKKIREAQLSQWSYIAVVGEKEMKDLSVNLRARDEDTGAGGLPLPMTEFILKLQREGMPSSKPLNTFEPFEGRLPTAAAATTAPVSENGKCPPTKPGGGKETSMPLRRAASKQFAELAVEDDIEAFLEHHPYVRGFHPTSADLDHFNLLMASGLPTTPNLKRWYEHIESFSPLQRESWAAPIACP